MLNVCAVKAPGFGERRREILEDIAVLTGGTVISEQTGQKLEKADPSKLGRVARVEVTKDETTLVGGEGERSEVEARIAQIRRQIETND